VGGGALPADAGNLGGDAGLGDAVVRPTAGIAYTAERTVETDPVPGQALVDRIAAELDPRGVLAA